MCTAACRHALLVGHGSSRWPGIVELRGGEQACGLGGVLLRLSMLGMGCLFMLIRANGSLATSYFCR